MTMDNQILYTTLISAGVGALVTGIFQIINKIIDAVKEKRKTKKQDKDTFYGKREQAYLQALRKLLFIRKGFDITRELLDRNETLKKEYDNEIDSFRMIDPTIRLYASDKIFQQYNNLTSYKIYAYCTENSWRLSEEAKKAFDIKINILSRLMQQDLEYREYDSEPNIIKCPQCGREHDAFVTCYCGLTYEGLQNYLDKILKLPQEQKRKEDEKQERLKCK